MKYPYIKNADLKLNNLCKKGINSLYKVEDRNYAMAYLEQELAIIGRQGSASMWIVVFNALEAVDAKKGDFFDGMTIPTMVLYALGLSKIDPISVEPRLYLEFVYRLHGELLPVFRVNMPEKI